ncbi:Caprin-2 [Merluccius polli]|uniref:Caprin-2 n=1 Tax=Merluccius polli TaxID=89951 RepID=A0AA47MXS3_MERPO|nr:Caprin-2 [Merluccius polli]
MVQLSPAECPVEADRPGTCSPKMGSPGGLGGLQLHLEVSTSYQGYDTYIEDGLICLKHKIRNMEKRKLKLEDYMKRVKDGGTLNKDQMDAVGQYQELLHNLTFAQELHCSLDGLTQNLLRAQKKAAKREQLVKMEEEKRRLSTVLRFQHLLSSLQQEHVRGDLLAGRGPAPLVSPQQLDSLTQLSGLLGLGRMDSRLSVDKQMETAAMMYFDLLDAKHKPVAGSTCKYTRDDALRQRFLNYVKVLKEQLTTFLDCEYFKVLPPPPSERPKILPSSMSQANVLQAKTKEISKKESFNRPHLTAEPTPSLQTLKAEFQAMKQREPPDSWDVELLSDRLHKPWRGAATFIPKGADPNAETARPKRKKGKKAKGDQSVKSAIFVDAPLEVFNARSVLPNDPILRKQQLEDLMMKIHGSFSFMQESLLDGEVSPTEGHVRLGRRASESPALLAMHEPPPSPIDVLPEIMHSTPLPARCMERKASLTNGEQSMKSCDLSFSAGDLSNESLQLADDQPLVSPPLYRRESVISVSLDERSLPRTPVMDSGKQSPCNAVSSPGSSVAPQGALFSPPARLTLTSEHFQTVQSVFKVNGSISPTRELNYKPETGYNSASTQTPPEFALPEDEPRSGYQSDYAVDNGGPIFLSPSQPSRGAGRPAPAYHPRGYVRGTARGGKGFTPPFRSPWWQRGGYEAYRCGLYSPGPAFVPGVPHRDPGPLLYSTRESGFQHGYRRGGARHNSSGWSDSSQVSSPDRDGAYPVVDSGHGDSLSVSTLEVPVTPHHHHHHHHQAAMLPVPLYPLTQPVRVAFTASRTANFAPGNLDQPVVFDQLHTNVGETYDARVGRFTCPVAGAYVFLFHILKLAVNVPLYVNLMCNDEVMVSAYANDGAPDHETASNHAILPLYPGDQVWLRLHRGAIYGSTWKYSTFSGFLLYQD